MGTYWVLIDAHTAQILHRPRRHQAEKLEPVQFETQEAAWEAAAHLGNVLILEVVRQR